ncbi:hypothetical protein [Salarchaeum sp. JOR-1]|uniref:hypothetical protein n=1 Tax=Salarchaeum sp. JOR-1 TaxID=2599399 RepID=UPI001198BDD6|nr:hypothetical protein [Salarchaeum sp. JOR-1]QDX40279.1 hypothetical protein FQU85_04965 [Salarchaeum sp. JOR-1]
MTRKSKREIEATLDEIEPKRKEWPADVDPFVLREMAGGWDEIPKEVLAESWRNALQPVDNDAEE